MWDRAESNRRHTDFQSVALPTELQSLTEEPNIRALKTEHNHFSDGKSENAEVKSGYCKQNEAMNMDAFGGNHKSFYRLGISAVANTPSQ